MADAMQGIMALRGAPGNMNQGSMIPAPGPGGGIDPSLIDPKTTQYARSNPEEFSQSMIDSLGQADPALVYELRTSLAGMNLPTEVVDALLVMVDILLQDPANYMQNRQMFVDEGVPEEILPPNFDPIFLTGLQMALSETKRNASPQRFAQGGIAQLRPIAAGLAQMGRNGDSMLAHINPAEARMLRVMGGSGTINPITGLPEYGWNPFKAVTKAVSSVAKTVTGAVSGAAKAVGDVVSGAAKAVGSVVKGAVDVVKSVAKPVVNAVKKIASSPIGKIALTVAAVYFMGPAGLNVAGTLGMTGATALGVNTALASTAVNLASGMSLKDSLKGGAISGLTAGTISTVFPSTLPAAYQAAPTGLESMTPDTLANFYGDQLTTPPTTAAAEATSAASSAAPTAAAPAAVTPGLESTNLIQPPSVAPPTTSPLAIEAPSIAAPQVQPIQLASAPGATMTDAGSGITGKGLIDTAYRPDLAAAAGQPVDYSVTTGVGTGTGGQGLVTGQTGALAPTITPDVIDEYNVMSGGTAGSPTYAGGPAPTPSLLDRGIGAVKTAYETVTEPIKNVYNEYLSPSRGMPTDEAVKTEIERLKQIGLTGKDAYTEAMKNLTPGMISQYGPLALAGTAALTAAGAFTPKQPPPPGIVNQDYMRTGSEPISVNIGDVRTTTAPDIGYGSTNFYNVASGYSPTAGGFSAPQFRVRRPEEYLDLGFLSRGYAAGGIASLNKTRTYPRKTGAINGPGTETSDSIPALLSDGEFVFTAKAVRGAGGGSRRAGAKRMYAMMKALEKKANA